MAGRSVIFKEPEDTLGTLEEVRFTDLLLVSDHATMILTDYYYYS